MDRGRRLTRLEDGLDPEAAVLRWLDEAQAYRSLVAYVRAVEQDPEPVDPLSALLRRLAESTYRAMRRRPTAEITKATRRAQREALVRYHLVVRLNFETEELLRVEGLRHAALVSRMRELSFRGQLAEHGVTAAHGADAAGLEGAWAVWRSMLRELVTSLYAAAAAREEIEARYLAGHAGLFDDLAEGWQDLMARVEGLHALAGPQDPIDDLVVLRQEAAGRVDAIADQMARMARADSRLAMGDDVVAAELVRPLLVD